MGNYFEKENIRRAKKKAIEDQKANELKKQLYAKSYEYYLQEFKPPVGSVTSLRHNNNNLWGKVISISDENVIIEKKGKSIVLDKARLSLKSKTICYAEEYADYMAREYPIGL